MECLTRKINEAGDGQVLFFRYSLFPPTIDLVPYHGKPLIRKMDPNLMGPSGMGPYA